MSQAFKRVLLDVETQRDFLSPGGSCYNDSAIHVVKNIYRLFEWVRENEIPVISTVLRLRSGETGPFGPQPHCIEGGPGEQKLSRTILPRRINMGLRNSTDMPADIFDRCQQLIFEKRFTDIFAHARLERLITELPMATFVLCGCGLSHGIVQAAIGLRSRGFGVILARDAVFRVEGEPADMALLRMEAKGVIFAETAEIVAPTPRRLVRPFRMPSPANNE
jgi:nicotinamidase-related amidase